MAEAKKFSPMRYTASDEEAAVQGALQIVGAAREDIEYEVLDKNEKGVTVRIRPRSQEAALVAAPSAPVVAESEPAMPEPAMPEPSTPEADFAPELVAEPPLDEAPLEDMSEEFPEAEQDEAPVEAPFVVAVAAEPVAPLDPEVIEHARATAQTFLDRMGLEARVEIGENGEGMVPLVIEGPDVGILIGKHGQTLQSFQYVLNLTLNNPPTGENGVRVVVDAGNYRARRQSTLEQAAHSAAARARREQRSIRLEPMPAHERRVVHMVLQGESDLATASEGREPMRRIVVTPAGVTPDRPQNEGRGYGERSYGDRPYGDRNNSGGGRGFGGYGGGRRYDRGR